jgi:membrane-associated phospholipid phosphatase
MGASLARLISVVFHPLLMPTYGFALIFFSNNYITNFVNPVLKMLILGIIFIFTFLLPVINSFILLKMGRISSIRMDLPGERTMPYASTFLYYIVLFFLFYTEDFHPVFKIMILGAALSILITLVVNLKWKISAHMTGIGGIAGAALGCMLSMRIDLFLPFIIILFISGVVGYARLKLEAHTPAQVYTGFAAGFLMQLLLMIFYPG